eukprot:Rhum_TRINITY_DN93_c0_g1::Rhum_TRINITY_DN93_c0_g1_i1::g.27::m.27
MPACLRPAATTPAEWTPGRSALWQRLSPAHAPTAGDACTLHAFDRMLAVDAAAAVPACAAALHAAAAAEPLAPLRVAVDARVAAAHLRAAGLDAAAVAVRADALFACLDTALHEWLRGADAPACRGGVTATLVHGEALGGCAPTAAAATSGCGEGVFVD